jgi:hypothetical protein
LWIEYQHGKRAEDRGLEPSSQGGGDCRVLAGGEDEAAAAAARRIRGCFVNAPPEPFGVEMEKEDEHHHEEEHYYGYHHYLPGKLYDSRVIQFWIRRVIHACLPNFFFCFSETPITVLAKDSVEIPERFRIHKSCELTKNKKIKRPKPKRGFSQNCPNPALKK